MFFLYLILVVVCLPYARGQLQAPQLVALHKEQTFKEGLTATLICSISSGDAQGLSFEWFKDGKRVNFESINRIRLISNPNNEDSKLRILNLTEGDEGIYSCVARNEFGKDQVSTRLNVKGLCQRRAEWGFAWKFETNHF